MKETNKEEQEQKEGRRRKGSWKGGKTSKITTREGTRKKGFLQS